MTLPFLEKSRIFFFFSFFFIQDSVNLFASGVDFQLDRYLAWKSNPLAWRIDAFSLNWSDFWGYSFPPFCLIGRGLKCVMQGVL